MPRLLVALIPQGQRAFASRTAGKMLLTCLIMFMAAMIGGALPLGLPISESKVSLVTCVGAGLLIATALAVVIPEGFHALTGPPEEHMHGEAHVELAHWMPGAVLVGGFVLMLLLDQVQHGGHGGHMHGRLRHDHDSDPEEGVTRRQLGAGPGMVPAATDAASRAFIGLLIHSAADGFAVGAASLSGNARLSAMVALAMGLHKAPTAFGLVTYLRASAWPISQVQQALLVFALASPIVTIFTFLLLMLVPGLASHGVIALFVLFSGGTFLHAACMHMLPEVIAQVGVLDVPHLLALIAGTIVPVVVSAFHSHE